MSSQERFSELDLSGVRVLLDCANGATFRVAPEIFRRLGATVDVVADQPDGSNINDGCGSTHLDGVVKRASSGDYDVGFAFDGDGDRVLAVDRDGQDRRRRRAARARRRSPARPRTAARRRRGGHGDDQLRLSPAMAEAGIEVATTAVGDRYVLDELRRRGWALGGEQSGHIIDLGFGPSGDGIASALLTLEALGGRDLRRARRDGEAAPAAGQHPRRRSGRRSWPRWPTPASRRRWRASTRGSPGAAACWCGLPAPSR